MKALNQSRNFTSYQCDKSRAFYIDFGHKNIKFSFCQLLAFRQQVLKIDLESHFNGKNKHGMELLMLCNREHVLVFNTLECVALKELIQGSFAMLELNSMLAASV